MIGVQSECGGLAPIAIMATTTTTPSSNINGSNINSNGNNSRATRDRALHAVEYYNSNVLKARIGAGLATTRNSVHERHHFQGRYLNSTGNRLYPPNSENLYRSNSSLELLHDPNNSHTDSLAYATGNLRREYGSHGSIDVISSDRGLQTTGEKFFAMLEDYQPAVLEGMSHDQRSTTTSNVNGNNGMHRHSHPNAHVHSQQNGNAEDNVDRGNASPKLRTKLHRLWAPAKPSTVRTSQQQQHLSQPNSMDENTSINISSTSSISITSTTTVSSADIEERQRRRAFAHYDCQSLTANLGYAAKLRGLLLARRRNTTTGASAAATYSTRSSTPDGDSADEDYGDGVNNDLLDNCPFFRNETGGEEEREVSLSRMQNFVPPGQHSSNRRAIHRPSLAYGVALLECAADESLWKQITCPFQKGLRPIEQVDNGARYYRNHFLGQEHQNWFGMDEQLGPVAISIKKEKLPASTNLYQGDNHLTPIQQHLYRLIVRTSELLTLRGSVVEESIPNPRGSGKQVTTKEVLEYVAPEVQIQCLRLGVNTPQCEQQLLKLDEQGLTNKYKVGVLYCRAGQSSEEEMYNNEEAGPAFLEFLETIGKRVRLKGFENYKAGLDNKTDSTGTHSIHATYQDCEVMFHVSTMLPFTPNNRQQLLRKRHIGNDIVTVVFQEPGALPFSPKNIRSQFQHVFIIVRAVNPCTENTHYRIAVSRSKEVPVFGPPVRVGSLYPKGKTFADFLLSKVINAENAAHRSEKFATMATRTRQEYLKDLTGNYCTATVVDTGQKFSIFPSKKKERTKPRFSGDLIQRGAFCWQVVLHDAGLSSQVDCFLGISAETFVLIEECTRQIIFVTACKSILGWSTSGNSLRVYHHQGECVTLNMRDSGDRDEQLEVIERLRAVTKGCGALELCLRRNPMGQLGFHVQPDGVVTQVEVSGQAWTSGLRQGYRLVEICKVAVSTLSHDQMVDLLKTSAQVTVTVIESFADYSPRRGCYLQNCKFNAINYEADYDQIDRNNHHEKGGGGGGNGGPGGKKSTTTPQHQQPSIVNHRRRYERNFSPPRSSNSSGYGTGSSSRSFQTLNPAVAHETRYVPEMGTLTSSSSGHSSNDDRWYDVLEPPTNDNSNNGSQGQTPNENHVNNTPGHIYQHPKLQPSHSLPLSSATTNRALSVHDPTTRPSPRQANIEYLVTRAPKIKDYVDSEVLLKNLHITENNNNIIANAAMVESLYSTTKKIAPICTTDEEDLNNDMPHPDCTVAALKRSATANNIYATKKTNGGGTVSSSASSSRNNSPRPITEAKLRAGITNRSINYQQRNSVNYTGSSSLMEDLKKLIDLDYSAASDDNFHNGNLPKPQKNVPNSHSLGNISSLSSLTPALPTEDLILMKNKSRSREGINLGSGQLITKNNGHTKGHNDDDHSEVIFTTARPATVVSTSSSPAKEMIIHNNKSKLHINEEKLKQSPRKQQMGASIRNGVGGLVNSNSKLPLLPDIKDMDWTTLVDTATRAMLQSQGHHGVNNIDDHSSKSSSANIYEELNGIEQSVNHHRATPPSQNMSEAPTPHSLSPSSSQNSTNSSHSNLMMPSSATMPELHSQVNQLSDRVLRETRRRKSLEHAVRRLTEENRRLQDESQAAVQQLRRFTEWLFQSNFMTK